MLIDRYLIRRVVTRSLVVLTVLAAVFAGYTVAVFLARAAAGFIRPGFVASLVLMKTVIATEVLLPVSLFIGVHFAVDHLRRHHETTALQAVGFGPRQAVVALLPVLVAAAVVVGALSVWVRPATYARLYDVRARAEAALELLDIEPGRFYVDSEGRRVVMVEEKTGDGRMGGVFIWSGDGSRDLVIRARSLLPLGDDGQGRPSLATEGLRVWEIDDDGCTLVGSAGAMTTTLDFGGLAPAGFKLKAAPTRDLVGTGDPEELAELQWRLTRPVNAFLLGLLALFTAGWSRPPGRHAGFILLGGLVCLGYYLASLTARSWVRDGAVGAVPGLWWVDVLAAAAALVLLVWPTGWRRADPR